MKYIEIPLKKCKIFLSEDELLSLLQKDINLYKEGIIRGKAILRSRKQKEREKKIFKT